MLSSHLCSHFYVRNNMTISKLISKEIKVIKVMNLCHDSGLNVLLQTFILKITSQLPVWIIL